MRQIRSNLLVLAAVLTLALSDNSDNWIWSVRDMEFS
jgi:hypothetical protein